MRPPTICCHANAASRAAARRPALRPRATAPSASRPASHLQRPAVPAALPCLLRRPSRAALALALVSTTPAKTTSTNSQRQAVERRSYYHSYDRPAPSGPFGPAESAILAAAHARVPSHGFTAEALALGARDAGYLDISAGLVPDGVFGLVRWHLATRREALAGRAAEALSAAAGTTGDGSTGRPPLSTAEKAEALVWERLMGNKDVIGRWQEALAIMAQPSYVPTSLKELAMLADEICFLAGDMAVDPTWYTKRASLSAIYATTELFMTNDHSLDFQDTREFLQRRFSEANDLGGAVKSVGQWLGFTASAGINVLRSKGMPV